MATQVLKHHLRKLFRYTFPRAAAARALRQAGDELELYILDLLVDSNRVAIDVGANWGEYARRLVGLSPHVLVFEPNPQLAFILRKTLPPNATVVQCAVSSADGDILLHVPFHEEGLATVERNHLLQHHEDLEVRSVRLDNYAHLDVGFVKIDVEGHELDVFAGATELTRRRRPTFLVEAEERHRHGTVAKLFAHFRDEAYKGVFLYRGRVLSTSEFNLGEMQDPRVLVKDRRRRDIPYVNNFIFMPAELAEATLLRKIEARLIPPR